LSFVDSAVKKISIEILKKTPTIFSFCRLLAAAFDWQQFGHWHVQQAEQKQWN
jgi:hypothetical protein